MNGVLYVDGQRAGAVANGATFEVYLSYGQHSISIESNTILNLTSKRSNADTLNIPMGAKKVIVTIKGKSDVVTALGGGAKLGIADVEVIR